MRRSTKRLLWMVALLPIGLLVVTVIYQQGMLHLEGKPRSFGHAFEWAAETITTTGYGRDNEWHHPFMQGFVVVVQFIGVFLAFLIFPIFFLPFFEERFEGRLPKSLPKLVDHVIIYRWGPAVTTLIGDLDRAGVPVVIVEEDEGTARRLHERGRSVVFARLEDDELELGSLASARGIVANGSDHENGVFIMSARQQGFTGTVVALVDSPGRRRAMMRAGADAVFTPSHAVAGAIAARASVKITPRVSGAPMLGDQVVVGEVRIDRESSLAGKTLAEAGIGARTGVTVLGSWEGGELVLANADTRLEPGSIVVAAGAHERMEELARLTTPVPRTGPFMICGLGEVGSKVKQLLTDAGEEVVVIDIAGGDDVVQGDALDPDVLARAGLERAQAVILSLGDDSETVFAAALIRDLAPEVIVLAAARQERTLSRLHRAGADFGFSVGQVAGQLMSFQLLGRQSLSLQPKLKIARAEAGKLAFERVLASDVRRRTGCSVVAVERKGQHVPLDADTVLVPGDAVYLSGTAEAIERYHEIFDAR